MKCELRPRQPDKYICFVGFDKALRSFFVYVANRGETDRAGKLSRSNHVVVWHGMSDRAITSVEDVKRLVSPYAELPRDVERELRTYEAAKEKRQGAAQ